MKLKPISGEPRSISDDDLCAQCHDCEYRPGEMSGCAENWPGLKDGDGYVQTCGKFRRRDLTNRVPQCFASLGQSVGDKSCAEQLVPVTLGDGSVEHLPLASDYLSTYLVVAKSTALLDKVADDGNGDRDYLAAVSVEEAVGRFLIANPRASYADILDHMEI